MMQALYFYQGLIGRYAVAETDGFLSRIWLGDRLPLVPEAVEVRETPLLKEARQQLDAYFAGTLRQFHLPLAPQGTPFQLKVWGKLLEIPYGTAVTYGELARRTGNAQAARAVGAANSRNPLPVLIPCHRVLGCGGRLTGYTGGLEVKVKLLRLERIPVKMSQ